MNNDQAKEYGQMLSLRGNLPGRFNQFYDFVEVTAATLNDWSDEINFKEKALYTFIMEMVILQTVIF